MSWDPHQGMNLELFSWENKCVTLHYRDLSQQYQISWNIILNETIKCRNSITLYIHFYLFCQTWILQHGVTVTFRTVPLWYLFSFLFIHSNACWMKPFFAKVAKRCIYFLKQTETKEITNTKGNVTQGTYIDG